MDWYIDSGGKITNREFPELPPSSMVKPYPAALWRVEGGRLVHALLPGYTHFSGAFCHAGRLKNVHIPQSVKRIGEESFRYTALTKVTISPDCGYFSTTFPEGCRVEFSDTSVQLCGSGGAELLDSDARRIFAEN